NEELRQRATYVTAAQLSASDSDGTSLARADDLLERASRNQVIEETIRHYDPVLALRYYDPVYSLVLRAPSLSNVRIGSSARKAGSGGGGTYDIRFPQQDVLRGRLLSGAIAKTIGIDTISSVAGFIQPGHRVDVEATRVIDTPDGKKPYSKII